MIELIATDLTADRPAALENSSLRSENTNNHLDDQRLANGPSVSPLLFDGNLLVRLTDLPTLPAWRPKSDTRSCPPTICHLVCRFGDTTCGAGVISRLIRW